MTALRITLLRAAIMATKYPTGPHRPTLAPGDLRVLVGLVDRLTDDTPRPVNVDDLARAIGMRPAHAYTSLRALDRAGFVARDTLPDGRRTYRLTLPEYQTPVVPKAA